MKKTRKRTKQHRKNKPNTTLEQDLEDQAAAEAKVPSEDAIKVAVQVKPPPRAVKTIRELIYWEYAKLIARAAGFKGNYAFTMSRYNLLKSGKIKMSEIERDDMKEKKLDRACIYCGSTENLHIDHIIPIIKGGPDRPHNTVLACAKCNESKGDRDIFEWYYLVKKEKEIPELVWSKYLKLVWDFHVAHRTLDDVDINKDGTLNILDLGAIFKKPSR